VICGKLYKIMFFKINNKYYFGILAGIGLYRGIWGTFGQGALMYSSKFEGNQGFKNLVKIKKVCFEVNF
jgi:hypothetical protein